MKQVCGRSFPRCCFASGELTEGSARWLLEIKITSTLPWGKGPGSPEHHPVDSTGVWGPARSHAGSHGNHRPPRKQLPGPETQGKSHFLFRTTIQSSTDKALEQTKAIRSGPWELEFTESSFLLIPS